MKGIAFAFFTVAVMCVTLGMAWGIEMSISGDHLLAPAHAHLNLVGWVTMGLFGLYYHNVPAAADKMLAKIHFGVAVIGVVLMVPGIVQAIQKTGETLAAVGSIFTIASMLIFLWTVVSTRQTA
jgi:cbb3-type cytochrome oxidase subunit 1